MKQRFRTFIGLSTGDLPNSAPARALEHRHATRRARQSTSPRVTSHACVSAISPIPRIVCACACVFAIALAMLLAGCSAGSATSSSGQETAATPVPEEGAHLNIASLKGPTSIGLATLMQESAQGSSDLYTFDIEGTADAIVPQIVQGTVDIALIPANLAATLYQKTDGGVCVIDINTLGVLYGVSQSDAFSDIASLRGATVYMTGKGTVPQYTLDALLAAEGMSEEDLTIEFKSEPAEVVAALAADAQAVGILPQPYVVAATMKVDSMQVRFSLTEEWSRLLGDEAGQMLTGVTIVRTEVLERYPQAVAAFLADHARSVQAVVSDPQAAAPAVVEAGIVDSEAIAAQAIPSCNIVCITGDEMKEALGGYLEVLYEQNPTSVGGTLPAEDFYCTDLEGYAK